MKRITAKFWKYTGNSIGENRERRTPRGYTLDNVVMVAAIADEVNGYGYDEFSRIVTKEEAKQIDITHHRGDSFGHEVTVKAPKSVWDKVKNI